MASANTGSFPSLVLDLVDHRPAPASAARTLVRGEDELELAQIYGAIRWGSPPPGQSMRQVLKFWLCTALVIGMVLMWY